MQLAGIVCHAKTSSECSCSYITGASPGECFVGGIGNPCCREQILRTLRSQFIWKYVGGPLDLFCLVQISHRKPSFI